MKKNCWCNYRLKRFVWRMTFRLIELKFWTIIDVRDRQWKSSVRDVDYEFDVFIKVKYFHCFFEKTHFWKRWQYFVVRQRRNKENFTASKNLIVFRIDRNAYQCYVLWTNFFFNPRTILTNLYNEIKKVTELWLLIYVTNIFIHQWTYNIKKIQILRLFALFWCQRYLFRTIQK